VPKQEVSGCGNPEFGKDRRLKNLNKPIKR